MKITIEIPDECGKDAKECETWFEQHSIKSCGVFMVVKCPTEDKPHFASRITNFRAWKESCKCTP